MVAQIKRTRPGQSIINRRIGVVNTNTGGEKVYEAQARMYQATGNLAFEFAKQSQQKEARRAAAEIVVEDENGVKEYKPISGFGASNELANQILNKRYADAMVRDVSTFAKELHIEEKNPERYAELYNDYVKASLKSVSDSGGDDFVKAFGGQLYSYGKPHINSLRLEGVELEKKQAQATYLDVLNMYSSDIGSLHGDQRNDMFNFAIADIEENMIAVYGFTPAQASAAKNNLLDQKAYGAFLEEGRDAPLSLFKMLEDPLSQDNEDLIKAFPQTLQVIKGMDATRRSEFNGRVSDVYNDRVASARLIQTTESTKVNYETSFSSNTAENRKNVDIAYGVKSSVDALNPSFDLAQVENNGPHPGETLYKVAGEFVAGEGVFANPDLVVPMMNRLVNINATQKLQGRTLSQYFGGDKGKQIEAAYEYYQAIYGLGEAALVKAYTSRSAMTDAEIISNAARNAEYDLSDTRTPSLKAIATNFVNTNGDFDGIPQSAKDDAVALAMYLLPMPTVGNVSGAISTYLENNHGRNDFYEVDPGNNSFAKYANSPASRLSPLAQSGLKQELTDLSKDGEQVFLRPISSSALSTQWAAYTVNEIGAQSAVLKNGVPVVFDSDNYEKAVSLNQRLNDAKIQLMRRAALAKPSFRTGISDVVGAGLLPYDPTGISTRGAPAK